MIYGVLIFPIRYTTSGCWTEALKDPSVDGCRLFPTQLPHGSCRQQRKRFMRALLLQSFHAAYKTRSSKSNLVIEFPCRWILVQSSYVWVRFFWLHLPFSHILQRVLMMGFSTGRQGIQVFMLSFMLIIW